MKHKEYNIEKHNIQTKYPEFADRLNYAMCMRDLNNLTLAQSIYVSASTISAYRRGSRQPNFEVLRSIAIALDVSTDFLLGLSDDMTTILPQK